MSRQQQETAARMQETDRRLRGLDELFNSQWGKLIEALVKGDLVRLLQHRDITPSPTRGRITASGAGSSKSPPSTAKRS